MQLPHRIEAKLVRVPIAGCWIWIGAADRYGAAWHRGRLVRAHRLVYELTVGEIPAGMDLLHRCDVPLCVNPHHTFPGTHPQNMADMVAKGRARAPTGDRHWTRADRERAAAIGRRNIASTHASGAANNNAKVDASIAQRMRAAHVAEPHLSTTTLGHRFGLGREQTRKILKGIVWKP